MYKVNLWKSAAFLYSDNKLSERERKKIPFKILSKTGINNEGGESLHSEKW